MKWFKTHLSTASHSLHNGNKKQRRVQAFRDTKQISKVLKALPIGRVNSFLKVAVPSPATRSAGSGHCSWIDCTRAGSCMFSSARNGCAPVPCVHATQGQGRAHEHHASLLPITPQCPQTPHTPQERPHSGRTQPQSTHRHTRNTRKGSKGNTRSLHHPQHTHDPKGIARRR